MVRLSLRPCDRASSQASLHTREQMEQHCHVPALGESACWRCGISSKS